MLELGKKAGTEGLMKELEVLRRGEGGRARLEEESLGLRVGLYLWPFSIFSFIFLLLLFLLLALVLLLLLPAQVRMEAADRSRTTLGELVTRMSGLLELVRSRCPDLTLVEGLEQCMREVGQVLGGEARLEGSPVKTFPGISKEERRLSLVGNQDSCSYPICRR